MATKPKGKGAEEMEGQGVTSWSSDDLRVKYRAEREREEAYQAFRLEEQVAEALEKDYGQVVMYSFTFLSLFILASTVETKAQPRRLQAPHVFSFAIESQNPGRVEWLRVCSFPCRPTPSIQSLKFMSFTPWCTSLLLSSVPRRTT